MWLHDLFLSSCYEGPYCQKIQCKVFMYILHRQKQYRDKIYGQLFKNHSNRKSNITLRSSHDDLRFDLLHTCRIAGTPHEATKSCISARALVSFASFTILRSFVCASWLLAITETFDPDVSFLSPAASPTVSDEPVVLASISSVSNELHCMVHVAVPFWKNPATIQLPA